MTQHPYPAVILLSRGGYGAPSIRHLDRMVATVATAGYAPVVGAFVDHAAPSLMEALDTCAAAAATRTLVVPVFVPGDAALVVWLAKVARRWQGANPASTMAVVLGAELGEHPAVDAALLAAIRAADARPDVRDAPPPNWESDPAGWRVLPRHLYHLLTCRGPRCTALGAEACWAHLRADLDTHGLRGSDERVLVAQTGCLYPCAHGPVLVVYPDAVWYGDLTPERIDRIVRQHFVDGQPVDECRIVPGKKPC